MGVFLARHYGRRLSVYLARPDFTPDKPEASDRDDPDLQAAFVDYLLREGLDRNEFSTIHELRAEVLKEDWPQLKQFRPIRLPYTTLGTLFKGRDEFLEQLRPRLAQSDAIERGGD